jgi:hypothetical protein
MASLPARVDRPSARRNPPAVNPYVQFALAMCLVVGLSLAGTAYLAATFNRKAKEDLRARLEPLAAAIGGEVDLDNATVRGRHGDALAFGRVANAQGGFGRLFHVELVDAAGGERWEWSNLPEKGQPEPKRTFEGDPVLRDRLGLDFEALATVVPEAATQRWGFSYDPEAGMVRLSRAMRNRADIPEAAPFVAQLDALAEIGVANRRAQGAGEGPIHSGVAGADPHPGAERASHPSSPASPHPPASAPDTRDRGSIVGAPASGDEVARLNDGGAGADMPAARSASDMGAADAGASADRA